MNDQLRGKLHGFIPTPSRDQVRRQPIEAATDGYGHSVLLRLASGNRKLKFFEDAIFFRCEKCEFCIFKIVLMGAGKGGHREAIAFSCIF